MTSATIFKAKNVVAHILFMIPMCQYFKTIGLILFQKKKLLIITLLNY